MKKYLIAIVKSVISTAIIHIYFLGGIYLYKIGYQHNYRENYLSKVLNIYYNHWFSITSVSIILICGFTFMFYNNVHERYITKMAKANEQKIKK
ncbi:hypothetical protein [Staphylococcus ureilyticus]|uniref:hypothetical protein n=1 Tax=Staphylococcus ureilyticus TaxID=94138 RepID=UPI003D35EAF1